MRSQPRIRDGGFILVSVLAVLAILAALVGGAAVVVRASIADATLLREDLNRDALTKAGLELAAYQVYMLRRPLTDLANQQIRLDGGVVTLTVTAENGKVDLNGADAALLAGLWRSAGPGSLSPETFAARVVDWRDKDGKPGRGGAERSDYVAAGRPGPANAPFEDVDELKDVLGVGVDGARTLKPYLTVVNPGGRISALAAPREVLRALPKMDAPTVERILQLRRAGPEQTPAVRQLLTDRSVTATVAPGNAFRVRVEVADDRKPTASGFVILPQKTDIGLYSVVSAESLRP